MDTPDSPPVQPVAPGAPLPPSSIPGLYAEADQLTTLTAQAYAQILGCLGSNESLLHACGEEIAEGIRDRIGKWQWLYDYIGQTMSSVLLGKLGWPQMIADATEMPPIGEAELAGGAGMLPLELPPLPVRPAPRPPLGPPVAMPIPQVPIGGGPFGVPNFPGQLPQFDGGVTLPPSMMAPLPAPPPPSTFPLMGAPPAGPPATFPFSPPDGGGGGAPPPLSVPLFPAPLPGGAVPPYNTAPPASEGPAGPPAGSVPPLDVSIPTTLGGALPPFPDQPLPTGGTFPPQQGLPSVPDMGVPFDGGDNQRPPVSVGIPFPGPATGVPTGPASGPAETGDDGEPGRPADGRPDAGGGAPAGPGAGPLTAAAPCPPVTVVIQCAPGAAAQVVSGPAVVVEGSSAEADSSSAGQQFISVPTDDGSVRRDVQELQEERSRDIFSPRRPSPLELEKRDEEDKGIRADEPRALDICADTEKYAKQLDDEVESLWEKLTGTKDGSNITSDSMIGGIWRSMPNWLASIFKGVILFFLAGLTMAFRMAAWITGCKSSSYAATLVIRSGFETIERWVGARFPEVQERLAQSAGMICPVRFPSPEEADDAYNHRYIDYETWRCYVRAGGVDDVRHKPIRDTKSGKPNAAEMVEFIRRMGQSAEHGHGLLHQAGVAETKMQRIFWENSKFTPGASDIVSFMVRDVFDESVVKAYGYDEEFTQKFQGAAKQWAYTNGMTEEQFLYFWRAHWQLPSNTEAYEFIRRLRPGRVPDEVATTTEDVRKLLEINDIPKYWRDRLIAISYHPMTRTDARRAYFIGALTPDETLEAIKDLGYAQREAELLFRYWGRERLLWLQNQKAYKDYSRGFTPEDDFIASLRDLGYTEAQIASASADAEISLTRADRVAQAKAIRARQIRGLLDVEDAKTELIRVGFASWQADRRARQWEQERKAKGKLATAAQLCDWWQRQFLDDSEYADALGRAGYDPSQVAMIMRTCRDKQKTKVDNEAKIAAAAAAKQAKQELTAKQKESMAANLVKARTARSQRIMQAAEERVQRRLGAAAVEMAKRLGGDASKYLGGISGWFKTLTVDRGYTRDGASQLIDGVVSAHAIRAGKDWQQAGDTFIDLIPANGEG